MTGDTPTKSNPSPELTQAEIAGLQEQMDERRMWARRLQSPWWLARFLLAAAILLFGLTVIAMSPVFNQGQRIDIGHSWVQGAPADQVGR